MLFAWTARMAQGWLDKHPWRYVTLHKITRLAKNNHYGSKNQYLAHQQIDDQLRQQFIDFLHGSSSLPLVKLANRDMANQEAAQREELVKSFPFRISLELTTACNLRCRMCTQSLLPDAKRYFLDPNLLTQAEPILRTATTVALTGWGETLVHPDFESIYLRVKAFEPSITMVTNGLCLTRQKAEFLVDNGLSELTISLDAVRTETYQFIRGINKLEQIQSSIRYFNDYRRGETLTSLGSP